MKIKVSKATPLQLDWLVATCEGGTGFWYDTVATCWVKIDGKDRALSKGWAQSFTPSTDWAQGGPIIEREGIWLRKMGKNWDAINGWFPANIIQTGPTPLIAAMRCFVASKLGDEVEVPEELVVQP